MIGPPERTSSTPLTALVAWFNADPVPLIMALYGYAGFGPKALAEAEELWIAFVQAREGAPRSRQPFDLLVRLSVRLGAAGSPPAELLLIQGLIAASQSGMDVVGLPALLVDLQSRERMLLCKIGLLKLRNYTFRWATAKQTIKEIEVLARIAEDPALIAELAAMRHHIKNRILLTMGCFIVGCSALVLLYFSLSMTGR